MDEVKKIKDFWSMPLESYEYHEQRSHVADIEWLVGYVGKLQAVALYWEGQASYWENQYWNKVKLTASERAIERLRNVGKVEDHPSMKALENKFKELK
jgi:hypothetical protein